MVHSACGSTEKVYSHLEIEKHNRIDDLWVIVDGIVYDVTTFHLEVDLVAQITFSILVVKQ